MPVSTDDFRARFAASRRKLEQAQDGPAPSAAAQPAAPRKQAVRSPAGQTVDIHKQPPHAIEAEQAVLGAMLQWPEQCVPEARRLLNRHHFYHPVNAELFDIMIQQFDAGRAEKSRWLISFTQFLTDAGRIKMLGGAAYLTNLATEPIAESSVSFYAQMLREKFILREMIAIGTKLVRASYGATDDQIPDIMDDFTRWMERCKSHSITGLNGSEPQTVDMLHAFDPLHDPNSIAGRRWIVRGNTSLWAGGSGYGKSALMMQLAIYWACGRKCFNLGPYRPARSLIVQAENDLGDMAESFQGIFAGIKATHDFDLEGSRPLIEQNVFIHRIVGKTGAAFLTLLDALVQETRCDIVWIDPLVAFAGCDLIDAEKTSRFLREGLFPIAVKRNVGLQVLHHVGKPPRDKDESVAPMSEIDYQYLGFGTSQIQNAFRAVNVLVPIAGTNAYKLVLSKRGDRACAKDVDGNWTRTLFLEHSREGICWLACEAPDQEQGRPAKFKLEDVLDELSVIHEVKTNTLAKRLHDERNMSRATFFRLFDKGKSEGRIVRGDEGGWLRKSGPQE